MPKIQHMVLLKFKPEVTPEKISHLFGLLGELQQLIPGITYYSGGSYSSDEGLNQGYTHGFLITFESIATRDAYLPHPEHERVKAELLLYIDSVIAFDFESNF
jgi:hypothetical protein